MARQGCAEGNCGNSNVVAPEYRLKARQGCAEGNCGGNAVAPGERI
ncbi:24596_t:CDS:2 [Dentiscutata erythropus]|uniref:24596_t:CDS:1 n=1 Tax=Dentiscutata erythropus TaxID=1348616 RepID=A0A9N9B3Y6_9GLOM|nr:24596_t:CDS:2 [Dentiscutata erythropus]